MIRALLFAALAALTASAAASAQSAAAPARYSAEFMWSLARLGDPAISPDGRWAVVPVTRFDIKENKGNADLWLFPVAGGEGRPLTAGKQNDTSPAFSPDGRLIAFVSKRGDDEQNQIYVIPVDGGEARRVTNVPTGASAPKWFPDGKRIAFIASIWLDLVKWEDQGKRKKERDESKMTGKLWERAPMTYWDRYLDDTEPHVFSIAVEGGEPTAITRQSGFSLSRQETSTSSYDISPDGEEVAFAADVDRSGIDPNYDVITVAACGCKPARNVTSENPADDTAPLYSPDGRWLAFTRQIIKGFYADRQRLMLHDRAAGASREIAVGWDRSADGLKWSPDSRALFGAIDDSATTRVYEFDASGRRPPRPVTTNPSFSGLALSTSGHRTRPTAVAIRQSFSEPPTLVRLDLADGRAVKLSGFNDAALATVRTGRVDNVTYAGSNGASIQMWVVYPPDFDPTRKYPVYMLLHGGPHNAVPDGVQWRWNAHVFASWGYIVTWHNFHGSSGFGQAFTDSINPDRITLPYQDTIKAAEWLMAKPYVDKERMAAGGGSYGGFLASTLLGRPNPFKALVAHAAVYNSFTQLAADYGAEKDRFFEFWERPEEFARYSPHTSAGNFNTPTLVIHGQLDMRVPVNHGMELFNTLQKRGVPSQYLYFPDENHWILKPQNSLYWYETKRKWLERFAPPGAR